MSGTVWTLAWTEYCRAFTKRAPGGRDLLWLTMLLAGVQLLALVLITAREGVLERSVDAFLGSEPGYGVPVWVLPNALRTRPTRAIDQGILDELDAAGFPVAPYRRYRAGSMITLPGEDLWAKGIDEDFGQSSAPRFAGLAAKTGGPLWPDQTPGGWADDTGPWKIALDYDLFAEYFSLTDYKAALENRIPAADHAKIPDKIEDLRALSEIWLNVRVHTEQLTRFQIVWGTNLGVGSQPSAFVAPAKLYHMIDLARRHAPKMCLFIENGPQMGRRVLQVKSGNLLQMQVKEGQAVADAAVTAFEALHERFPGLIEGNDGTGIFVSIDFHDEDHRETFARGSKCDPGVDEVRLTAIADELGVPYDRQNPGVLVPATSPFRIDDRAITVPADTVLSETKGEATASVIDGVDMRTFPVAAGINGYPEALVFARNRLQLFELIAYLKCEPAPGYATPEDRSALCKHPTIDGPDAEPDPRLVVNPIYTDALTRFSFLSELIDKLRTPLGVILVTLLIAVLFVQLGTVIGHRRVRYGMMISNGLTWGQVRLLLMIQVGIGALAALAVATLATMGMRLALAPGLDTLSQRFRSVTDGRVLEALPLSLIDVAMVGAMALVTSLLLARFLLWFTGVSSRKPMDRLLR